MTNGKRILFVAPFYEDVASGVEYLKGRGYQVEVDATAGVGERLAKERFDLLFIVGMIPPAGRGAAGDGFKTIQFENAPRQLTGWEFLKRLRRSALSTSYGKAAGTPYGIPVIFVTGNRDVALPAGTKVYAQLREQRELVPVISWPFNLIVLESEVREALPQQ